MSRRLRVVLRREDTLVLGYVVAWLAGLAWVIPQGGTVGRTVDALYFVMPALAALAQWRAARAAPDARTRRGWRFLALSSVTMLAVGMAWTAWQPLTGTTMPGWLDRVTQGLYVPFALAGFLSFPADPAFRWRDPRAGLDALLFFAGAAALSWHFGLAPGVTGEMPLRQITAVAEWVLTMVASLALLRVRDRATRAAIGLALAAQLLFVLTDHFSRGLSGPAAAGFWLNAIWFVVWVLRWMGARRAVLRVPERPQGALGYRGSLAPALLVAGAYALLFLSLALQPDRPVLDLAAAAVGMTGLLLVRQYLTRRENVALVRETARQTATFRSIVASATDLILTVRADLRIAFASPSVERLAGAVQGRSFKALLHPDDRAGVLGWMEERTSSLGQRGYRCRLRAADGHWRDVELRAQHRLDDPAVRGYVINGRDISQELALEQRLGHARKLAMLSEMAGRIAHAFNNTLAALQGHAEVLARDLPAGSAAHEDARAIRTAAERGAGITRQLLGFTGRHVIRPEPVRPAEVLAALAPSLERLLGPGRPLALRLDAPDAVVVIDRAQLEQVVMNLVTNARDAMPDGGRLEVAVRRDGGRVRCVVRDEGVGMAPELAARAFEPFFTTKRPGAGTGLGLPMVASIVRRAGGTVALESVPGAGTTVTITLPEALGAPEPARVPPRTPSHGETEPPGGAGCRVLLVDDDALVRNATARMLERAGHTVIGAEDGARALAIAEDPATAIDLLLTDLMMPGLSGRDVIARFRVIRPGVPIVCITGYATEREDDRSLALQVSGIVAKPFTAQALARAIDEARRAYGAGARSPGR